MFVCVSSLGDVYQQWSCVTAVTPQWVPLSLLFSPPHSHTDTTDTFRTSCSKPHVCIYTIVLLGGGCAVHAPSTVYTVAFRDKLLYSLFPYLPMVIAVYELVRLSRIYTVTLFMCQVNVWLVRVHSAAIHSVSHTPSHLSLKTNY